MKFILFLQLDLVSRSFSPSATTAEPSHKTPESECVDEKEDVVESSTDIMSTTDASNVNLVRRSLVNRRNIYRTIEKKLDVYVIV